MAYTDRNFKSKKALKAALDAGETVTYYQPGGFAQAPANGTVFLEGPHYPAAHTWYAKALAKDNRIVSISRS
jgi:hypothetical protein